MCSVDEIITLYLETLKDYDEESLTVDNDNWTELKQKTCHTLDQVIHHHHVVTYSPKLVLFFGGLAGNVLTTKSLSDDELEDRLVRLQDKVLEMLCSASPQLSQASVVDWLMETRGGITLCSKLLILISAALKAEPQLTKSFLYRDAGLWTVFSLPHPQIDQFTPALLPIALNVSDSFVTLLATAGLRALLHIGRNSFRAQLRYSGQGDVIYDALRKHLWSRDPDIFMVTVPCMIEFMKIFDPPPSEPHSLSASHSYQANGNNKISERKNRYFCRYDELVRFVLNDLRLCSDWNRKRILLAHLKLITPVMGRSMTKFIKPYLVVLETVLVTVPEIRNRYPVVKEMMLENLLDNLDKGYFVKAALEFVIVDLLKILMAFVDESFQFGQLVGIGHEREERIEENRKTLMNINEENKERRKTKKKKNKLEKGKMGGGLDEIEEDKRFHEKLDEEKRDSKPDEKYTSRIVQLTVNIFSHLWLDHREQLSEIYRGVVDVIVNKDHFLVLIKNGIFDLP